MFPNFKSDKPLHKYTLIEKDRVKIKAQEVILVIIYMILMNQEQSAIDA